MLHAKQVKPVTAVLPVMAFLMATLGMTTSCDRSDRPVPPETATPVEPSLDKPEDSPLLAAMYTFHAPMIDCMARVWPAAVEPYRRAQILMTGAATDARAYRWRGEKEGFSILRLEAQDLDAAWFAPYNFGDFEGLRTLGVNYDALSRDLVFDGVEPEDMAAARAQVTLETIFHESFHLFGQDGFGSPAGGRDQEYPIAWQPRYLRAQLLQTLQDALIEGADLGPSAYWYSRYLTDYLDEALYLDYVDRSEGSAEYAGKVMGGLAKHGCHVSEPELLADLKADLVVPRYQTDASTEPYDLGFVAGLLLRERAVQNWEDRVAAGATMLGVLLADIDARPQPPDRQLEQQVELQVAAENAWIEAEFAADFDALDDAAHYRLVFDLGASEGSFSRTDSYRLADHAEVNAFTRLISADVRHEALITLRFADVFQLHGTPCDDAYLVPYVVPLAAAELHTGKGGFSMNSGEAIFRDLPARVVDDGGYRWLCPPAAATLPGKTRAPERAR